MDSPVRTTSPVIRCLLALSALLLSGVDAYAARRKEPVGPPPDLTKGVKVDVQKDYNLGPTGARGWMFVRGLMTAEARQILITQVDEGSPADGVLEAGDVILGIGGKRFAGDARKTLGRAIEEAEKEENKGILKLIRWRKGKTEEVALQLKVMGTYSDTAPYDCPKSKKILEDGLRYIAQKKAWGRLSIEGLALLASGRPEYIRLVKEHLHEAKWAKPDVKIGLEIGGKVSWSCGYRGLLLTEYYLATGDKVVLPAIREYAVKTAMGQGGGGAWGHGFAWKSQNYGKLHGRCPGYGALNSAGLPCFMMLMMAKRCGIEHEEVDAAIGRSHRFFGHFIHKGSIPYGYHSPWMGSHDSNGKNGMGAVAFGLVGDRRGTRYYAKMATAECLSREGGHTGNYFNYLWGTLGVSRAGPRAVAEFLKPQRWYYELVRRWDGSFIYQHQGGGRWTYRGLSSTASYMLAFALPLRKTYLTGKDADKRNWLSAAEVDEAIAAGKLTYDDKSADELLTLLASWSPIVRARAGKALGKKEENVVPRLIRMLAADDRNARIGACHALAALGERGAPAVPALARLLSDEDGWVHNQACYALANIGQPARPAAPAMFKAAARKEPDTGLDFKGRALALSLFFFGRSTGFGGIFKDSLEGVDWALLYPATRRLLKVPFRGRGSAMHGIRNLPLDRIVLLADDILNAIENRVPYCVMFGDAPRRIGLELLAKHRIAEGIELCLETMDPSLWGAGARVPGRLRTLQSYGGSARFILPRLKAMRWELQGRRELVEQTIRTIEEDKSSAKLIRFAELVARRVEKELSQANDQAQRVRLCRQWMKDYPHGYLLPSAALRWLVSARREQAFGDILAALGHWDERTRQTAVELGAQLPGQAVTRKWAGQLDSARGQRLAGVLLVLARRGDSRMLGVLSKYLKHEEEVVRAAAVSGIGASGAQAVLGQLVDFLTKAEGDQDRASAEEALAAVCRRAKNTEEAIATLVAILPKAPEAARCSLVRALGRVAGARALAAVTAAAGDESQSVREAAFGVLLTSPDSEATEALLAVAKSAPRGPIKDKALEGSLRRVVAGQVPAARKLSVLEKIIALGGPSRISRSALAELQWLPSVEALRLAQSLLRDKRMAEHAAPAAVAVAGRMDMSPPKHRSAVLEAMKEILQTTKNPKTLAAAKALLRSFKADLPREK